MIKRIQVRSWGGNLFSIPAVVEGGLALHPQQLFSDDGSERAMRRGSYSITHLKSGCTMGRALLRPAAIESFRTMVAYRIHGVALGDMDGCEILALGSLIAPGIGRTFDAERAAATADVLACKA